MFTKKEIVNQISAEIDVFHDRFPKTTGFGTKTEEERLRRVLWNCWAHKKIAVNYKKAELISAWKYIEDQNNSCF